MPRRAPILGLALDPIGARAVTCGAGGGLHVWNAATGALAGRIMGGDRGAGEMPAPKQGMAGDQAPWGAWSRSMQWACMMRWALEPPACAAVVSGRHGPAAGARTPTPDPALQARRWG